MAFTIGRYLLQANKIPIDSGLNCANMQVDLPLIASPDRTSQLLRVSASANWRQGEMLLKFFSVNAESKKIADHAICTMKITQTSPSVWLSDWKRLNYMIQSRIVSLQSSVEDGRSHKLKRGLVYKLFSSFVEYETNYQGMQEVILDAEGLEATARVVFQTSDEGFAFNPCWIDSFGHIAGFIMNGTDNANLKDSVFINHGVGSHCFRSPFHTI
jgi:naphtho-gamma-pyrone polyketide synthase